jgi:hypothetical protein
VGEQKKQLVRDITEQTWNLRLQQLDNLSDPEPQIDKADELRRKYGTANGQLWQVGPHRIVCGDSREPQTVGRLWDIA